MNIPPLTFAADELGALIQIAVAVVLGLGWLIKFIATKNQQQAAPPARRPNRPAAPRDERIKNEIEVFLQEVTGRKAPPQARREAPREAVKPAEPPKRRPVAPPRPAAPKKVPPRQISRTQTPSEPAIGLELIPEETPSIRPGGAIAGRKGPGSGDLGKSVVAHLAEYMDGKRIEKHVQQDLRHAVNEAVKAHLGQFTAVPGPSQGAAGAGSSSRAREIVQLLRNPRGVQQAIMIKEVLERRSLRSRRRG